MIYANVIGCDLGPKITPIGSRPRCCGCMCWRRSTSPSVGVIIFRCGITMTLPVLLVTLAALALRLSFNQP